MTHPQLVLRPGSERGLVNGHPWIFSGAVATPPHGATPGSVVDVVDQRERFVGRGHYNPRSHIRVRLLTHDAEQPIDEKFFCQRIARAFQLRRQCDLRNRTNAYRIVHGESDGMPGLIVDRYADFIVVQFHTLGMHEARNLIIDGLQQTLAPLGIFERSDVGTRRAEGLTDRPTGPLLGATPPPFIEIRENGVRLFVDVHRGQKSGFFLDQRDNRTRLRRYANDSSLLSCFGYTAGFSAHALAGGAHRTLDVDISPQLAQAARRNLEASGKSGQTSHYLIANAFSFVQSLAERGPRFDIVVLDPPSLLRRRGNYKRALGVYTKLNRNALHLVRNGGLLVTCSCSSRISQDDFYFILQRAATGAKVEVSILHYSLHPEDHPVNPAFPEGRYLKCIFARVWR